MTLELEKSLSYKKKVYKVLKKAIISTELQPGEVLNERDLANTLDVSRTPVREAIHLLINEGWVTEKKSSKIVTPINLKDIEEIYQLRLHNELLSLKLAFIKIGTSEFNKLENLIQEMETYVIDFSSNNIKYKMNFLEKDKEFHLEFAKISGYKRLYNILLNLTEQFIRFGLVSFKSNTRFETVLKEHNSLLKAVKDKNLDKSQEILKKHLLTAKNVVKENWSKDIIND